MPAFVLSLVWALWPLLTFAGGLGLGSIVGLAALLCSGSAFRALRLQAYMFPLLAFFIFLYKEDFSKQKDLRDQGYLD